MKTELKLGVPVQNKYITDAVKDIVHKKLTIHANLEMSHEVQEVYFERKADGSFGRKMLDIINEDETLTDDLKRSLAKRYETDPIEKHTAGSIVNKATGAPIDPDNVPVGVVAIPELEYWQSIKISELPVNLVTVADVVYFMMGMNINKLVQRGVF